MAKVTYTCKYMEDTGLVETGCTFVEDVEQETVLAERRELLNHIYVSLPDVASLTFWQALTDPDMPLEIITRALRAAIERGDGESRNRLIEIVIRRIQNATEIWANKVLTSTFIVAEERLAVLADLCADLYESVIRSLLNPERAFWEENFQHCLLIERQRIYHRFLVREGRMKGRGVRIGDRVPYMLIDRLDLAALDHDSEFLDVEDEQAQRRLHRAEYSDLLPTVLRLPGDLKVVVLLIFWEGKSEKECARLLHICERTVRKRLSMALTTLKQRYAAGERGCLYG